MGLLNLFTPIHRLFFTPWTPVPKSPSPLRIGLISTARINSYALILPTYGHPEAVVTAVSSRTSTAAKAYAQAWNIPPEKAYGTYQSLLDDPDIDAVFIGLPNGLHAEWVIKAISAGKHVLVEKPFASNATEARLIQSTLEAKNATLPREKQLHVLEAFHYRFHPFAQTVRSWLTSGVFGDIISTSASASLPPGFLDNDDVRFKYDELAGGALMDLTYAVNITRYMLSATGTVITTPSKVVSAEAMTSASPEFSNLPSWSGIDPRIDLSTSAELEFQIHNLDDGDKILPTRAVKSTIKAILATPESESKLFGVIPRVWSGSAPTFVVECERATITMNNFIGSHLGHYVEVKDKSTGRTRRETYYWFPGEEEKAEGGWLSRLGMKRRRSTYYYQLDAFVKRIRGEEGHELNWISLGDSIAQMETIDMIYEKCGLPVRVGSLGIGGSGITAEEGS